jgi:hypothetical protein
MDDSEVMLCKIRNVLQDENLATKDKSDAEKLAGIAPVKTTCGRYFSYKGEDLELWGQPMKKLNK